MKRTILLFIAIMLSCLHVVAEKTNQVAPAQQERPDAPLANTYWKLLELEGKPVILDAAEREVHMVLELNGKTVRGFAGCNQFFGGYAVTDNKLVFSALGSSQMFCENTMELEGLFLAALGKTAAWSISSERLQLLDADGLVVALFESVYLH
jgi:heat shock protein HslJ